MTYTRFDKLDWLKETCSKEFLEKHLIDELVSWIGEDCFEEFYDHLCCNWNIRREPNDPNDIEGDYDY